MEKQVSQQMKEIDFRVRDYMLLSNEGFSQKIKDFLRINKMTAIKFAEGCSISTRSVQNYKSGNCKPRVRALYKIVDFMHKGAE